MSDIWLTCWYIDIQFHIDIQLWILYDIVKMRRGGYSKCQWLRLRLFVSRWGKTCLGCLAGIRCLSAPSQPLLRGTHRERELLGTSLDPRVTRRVGRLGEQEFLSKYNRDRLRRDIFRWPLFGNFLKLFPLCEKKNHACSDFQTNCKIDL